MNLKEIRKSKGLTQKQVADSIGCSTVVYSRYETGDRQPSIDVLIKLAEQFDITVDQLIGNKQSDTEQLSEFETSLLSAFRQADDRARQDALILLKRHTDANPSD